MKKIIVVGLSLAFLVACGSTEENKGEVKGPSQEELNAKLKQEAAEASFAAANGNQYEFGKKIKATGKIAFLMNKEREVFPVLTLITRESDHYGMYTVKVAQSGTKVTENEITLKNGTKLTKGTIVTVYGAYDGKDKTGFPLISSTVIEAR
ncbi:hypothetical protein IQ781_27525 (plasmid) [Bacillus sp. N447-1]|uniref:hypothetical protein n=1 Tax=Bacillus sp. N447-1 TaxID=2789208 RepID=UPI001F61D2C3|nr:hypothetical protein [Bacillus sp. N447-1]UNT71726.1 hypothetical protein IQ781_27525 [Bacillus sp. N447-1]